MLAFAALASLLVLAIIVRFTSARSIERATAARLPLGADGIIIGAAAIELEGGERGAVLLLHGFGDTPQTLEYLAREVHVRGWAVRAPLLPGHGRTLRAFAASRGEEWIGAARAELTALRARHREVSLVGLSMGGAIASILAAETPDLPAVALVAPYLEMPVRAHRFARFHGVVGLGVAYLRGGSLRSIHDTAEREKNRAYRATTARLLHELAGLADRARAALPRITAPTLIVQSRDDNRVAPEIAERAHAALGAREKRLVWVEGCGHVITVDRCRERVLEEIGGWLETFATGGNREPGVGSQEDGKGSA